MKNWKKKFLTYYEINNNLDHFFNPNDCLFFKALLTPDGLLSYTDPAKAKVLAARNNKNGGLDILWKKMGYLWDNIASIKSGVTLFDKQADIMTLKYILAA